MSEQQTTEPDNSQSGPVEESVLAASAGDRPTSHDFLGFKPYVEAVAGFLENDSTEPPLTLSVEGDWGSGKSSFMQQLELALKKRSEEEGSDPPPTVQFNAWRHDKAEALWAAFALGFTRKLSEDLKFKKRWLAHIKLIRHRFRWQDGWADVLRAIAIGGIFILATIAVLLLLFIEGPGWAAGLVSGATTNEASQGTNEGSQGSILPAAVASGGIVAYAATVIWLWKTLRSVIGNPLAINLKRYAASPDYESRVAFIEQFHEDFDKIVAVYAENAEKVYVFIDDLDRCAAPKAAELMNGLNLMLSESGRIIYIIGMDREKVAAGYAANYRELLPFLAPVPASPGTPLESSFDAVTGLEYGYAFVEKFVQIPFQVPQPAPDDVERLLDALGSAREADQTQGSRQSGGYQSGEEPNVGNGLDKGTVEEPPTEEQKEVRKRIKLDVSRDSETIRDIVLLVSPALNYNPRRILQFINLFRLRTYIACDTALFDQATESSGHGDLTLQQLGKFVAISLRWPLFLSESDSYPALLTDLQKLALDPGGLEEIRNAPDDTIGRSRRTLRRWAWQQDLIELLRAGFVDRVGNVDKDKESDYSLAEVNVDKLLQVSPRTRPAPSVSVGVEPTDVSAAELYNRAGTLVQQGRYDEALATYDRALALNPSYSAALYNRGNVLRQLERNEEALEDYERALAVQPDLDAAWFNKGSVLSSLGRYRQALEAYDQVLRLRPDRTDAIQNRKLVLERIDATEGRTERRRETRTESRTKGTPSSKRPPSTPIDKTPPPKGPSKTD